MPNTIVSSQDLPMFDSIWAKINETRAMARRLLIHRVRQVLKKHSNLECFTMAMGAACFHVKPGRVHPKYGYVPANGDYIVDLRDVAYLRPVLDIMDDFDSPLKLSGDPLKVLADGTVLTDW